MRIGLLSPNYPGVTGPGGIGTYTRNLAHALCRLGHEVHVVTPGMSPGHVTEGPLSVHLIHTGYFRLIDRLLPGSGACYRVRREMRRIVRRHRLDIIEFPNWEGLGSFFCFARPVPVVVRLHTSSQELEHIDGTHNNRLTRWDVRRERWVSTMADVLVTHSEAHRQRMAEELCIDASRIRVVRHGVAVDQNFVRPTRKNGHFTVIHVGRMEKRKGVVDLIRAIPEVLNAVPETRFVFVGSDRPHCPGGRTHAQFIEEELPPEVRGRISLVGRLPDEEVDRMLQQADLLVSPSLYESFGLVFPEAMRWGTAVIGTRVGGIPEIVEDGKNGILVSPASPGELAAAMISLLQDSERRRTLGEAGRLHIERHFNTVRMAQEVEKMYEEALQEWRERNRSSLRSQIRRDPKSRLRPFRGRCD